MLKSRDEQLDKRVIRTRKLLLEAFFDLMRTKEFSQISVQDITDRAEINRATFYAHFLDKQDLFEYSVQAMFQEHLDATMPSADSFTVENLRALSASTLSFLTQFLGHCAPSKRNQDLPFENLLQSHLQAILVEWLGEVDLSNTASREMIATATSWALFGAVMRYARGHLDLPQELYIDQLMDFLTEGIPDFVMGGA